MGDLRGLLRDPRTSAGPGGPGGTAAIGSPPALPGSRPTSFTLPTSTWLCLLCLVTENLSIKKKKLSASCVVDSDLPAHPERETC